MNAVNEIIDASKLCSGICVRCINRSYRTDNNLGIIGYCHEVNKDLSTTLCMRNCTEYKFDYESIKKK